jgi:putative endonuclease
MGKTVKRVTGDDGESRACLWLSSRGFRVIERNVSNSYGEIDIIAQKDGVIHFIEVKTRKNSSKGYGVEAVGRVKLSKVLNCAQAIALEKYPTASISIDAISIDEETIRFFENITL